MRTAWGAVVAAAVVVAGCGAPSGVGSTAPASSPPTVAVAPSVADVSAEVLQYRRDEQRAVVQVKVGNEGSSPVHVASVRLDTTTFSEPVQVPEDYVVRPGAATDFTIPLGPASCRVPREPEHTVTVVVDGQEVSRPVDGDVLERVAARRCALAAVAEQVQLSVRSGWEPTTDGARPAVRGTLLVTPRAGHGDLTLRVEGATTLFTVVRPAVARLSPGQGPLDVPFVLAVARCDAHAVAEDTKGYLLPVRVSGADAEPVLVEVTVPVPDRVALQDLIDRSC